MRKTLVLLSILAFTSAEARELFPVNADQFERTLEVIKAAGAFKELSNECSLDEKSKDWECRAQADSVLVFYAAETKEKNLTSIGVRAAPADFTLASGLVTIVSMLANKKLAKASSAARSKVYDAENKAVAQLFMRVFVNGGSAIDAKNGSYRFFVATDDKKEVLAHIAPSN